MVARKYVTQVLRTHAFVAGAHLSDAALLNYFARSSKFGWPLQDSFDAAVQENITEFDMTVSLCEMINTFIGSFILRSVSRLDQRGIYLCIAA